MQWDGKAWKPASGWIAPDNSVLDPLVKASAEKYAKKKGITRAIAARKSNPPGPGVCRAGCPVCRRMHVIRRPYGAAS